MSKQIKYGALIAYIGIFINIISGIIYTPWMIRSIGKKDYGLYILSLSIISIFVFDFGLSQTVARFVSRFLAEKNIQKVNCFLGIIFKLYILADILIFLILTIYYNFIPYIYKGLTLEELAKFKIVFIISASFSILSFPFIPLNGILQSYELFIQLRICDLIHKIVIVFLMSICLLIGGRLYSLVIVNFISGLIVIIIKLVTLSKSTDIKINWHYWNNSVFKSIMNFSIWLTISLIAQRCIINICPSILGLIADSRSIAIFGIAVTIEGYVYIFTSAINGMFLPKVTRISIENNNNILDLMIKVGRIQLFILGLIILGFLCFGKNFIFLWLGNDFYKSFLCTIMLIAPSLIGQTQQIATTSVIVENKVKRSAIISIVKAITNLLLAYPLGKIMGVYGVALSVLISNLISLIQFNLLYHNILKINIFIFFKKTYGNMIIPMIFCCSCGILINIIFSNNNWLLFFVKVVLFSFIYLFIMIKFVMSFSEKELLFKYCPISFKKFLKI